MTDPTDAELVRATRGGNAEAYAVLVTRYQGHVYGLAYSLRGNWADAQDMAQETFVRAYVNLDQLREPERFAAWLRRVTFGVAMNWLRAHQPDLFRRLDSRVDLDSLEIADFRPGPAEVVENRELADAVLRAIQSLPAKYRVPLTMFHLDGLSYQKVADFLDIPLGTAKSLIHRARAKLKSALAGYAEEVSPTVQEVFNEHKLPSEFARQVLENVPTLAWRTGRECTFAGALEAALAATPHQYKYSDILGFTGLAFRTRWFCGNEQSRWCPSCAVGEMDEEIIAVEKTMGWPLRVAFLQPEDDANVEQITSDIVTSINAGRPVLAYEPQLNMDVVFGYEEAGKILLLRDYFKGEEPLRLPPSKLGFLILFIGDHAGTMPRRAAVIESLKVAVRNWRRQRFAAGPGEYWYGKAALDHWIADLGEAGDLSQTEQEQLCGISWWNFTSMHDARRAAVTFLHENMTMVDGDASKAVARAAQLYQKEADLLGIALGDQDMFAGSDFMETWTTDVQRQEQEVLRQARECEEAAVREIEEALLKIGCGRPTETK